MLNVEKLSTAVAIAGHIVLWLVGIVGMITMVIAFYRVLTNLI